MPHQDGFAVDPVHRLRRDALTHRQVDDATIALDLAQSSYLTVNATGSLLWSALADGATTAHLEGLLEQEGASAEQACADVAAFLSDLQTRGLLENG